MDAPFEIRTCRRVVWRTSMKPSLSRIRMGMAATLTLAAFRAELPGRVHSWSPCGPKTRRPRFASRSPIHPELRLKLFGDVLLKNATRKAWCAFGRGARRGLRKVVFVEESEPFRSTGSQGGWRPARMWKSFRDSKRRDGLPAARFLLDSESRLRSAADREVSHIRRIISFSAHNRPWSSRDVRCAALFHLVHSQHPCGCIRTFPIPSHRLSKWDRSPNLEDRSPIHRHSLLGARR